MQQPMIKKKILIIEDNKADRLLINQSLEETLGDSIDKYWASSIHETRELLLSKKMDLIILDLTLEDSTGFSSVLNLHQFVNDTPVIIFTSSSDEKLRYRALSTGIRGYLKKDDPDSYVELAEMIITVMQQNMLNGCRLAGDCPQNINSIKISLTDLIGSVDELKNKLEKLNSKIMGNGKAGYETRLEKLENFKTSLVKYWWILFPIVASAFIGGIVTLILI